MDYELKSVLISDDVDQQCIDILSSNGVQVVKNTKLTKDQLKAEIAVILNRMSEISCSCNFGAEAFFASTSFLHVPNS